MTDSVSQSVVSAHGVTRRVRAPGGELSILEGVDLDVQAGDAVAILGTSGSGKSTLLGLLAGLDAPSGGEVHLLGAPLHAIDEDARAAVRAGQVGFVFQSFQLVPGLTALENVMLPLELAGREAEAESLARQTLTDVGLEHRLEHYPHQLSGGEQQRVAVARAFAPQPRVLFADEPTGNLDARTGEHVSDLIFRLREAVGTALILVTHDRELAARCERRFQLREGVLEAEA
jgi:putative ABC transport system ATP-binding protein